jgi:hypothetical protein
MLSLEAKKPGQLFVQIIGEENKTEFFELKNAESDENNEDKFHRTDAYLGTVINQFNRMKKFFYRFFPLIDSSNK